jgi:hypothetical protein
MHLLVISKQKPSLVKEEAPIVALIWILLQFIISKWNRADGAPLTSTSIFTATHNTPFYFHLLLGN